MSDFEVRMIPIDEIKVGNRKRSLRDLTPMIESLRERGQLQPIRVTDTMDLVYGYHRLKSAKQLGWGSIAASVASLSDIERELEEIDENLIRNELTILESAEHLKRRKELYLKSKPQTARGVAGAAVTNNKRWGSNVASENISFAKETATVIGVTPRTVEYGVKIASDICYDLKDRLRDTEVANAKTQLLEIARMSDEDQQRLNEILSTGDVTKTKVKEAIKKVDKEKRDIVAAKARKERGIDIGPPKSRQHFDVWNFSSAKDDAGVPSHFGRVPPQVMENLVWLFTEPDQWVFDPFAGGGTTYDICRSTGRNCWVSDLVPVRPEIYQHNICEGWPSNAPDEVNFVFLDPPYWKQAKGRYSELDEDLGNQSLEQFMEAWKTVVETCYDHLADNGLLAFIISPTQDGHRVVDHAFDMYQVCIQVGFQQHRRIIVPYQTQQATGQQVESARKNRQLLKLYRDLVLVRK